VRARPVPPSATGRPIEGRESLRRVIAKGRSWALSAFRFLAFCLVIGGAAHASDALDEARTLLERWRFDEAAAAAREALAEVEAAHGPDSLETAEALDHLVLAMVRGGKGRFEGVREAADRAVAIKEKRLGPEAAGLARSLDSLAYLLLQTDDVAGARRLFERALAIQEKALGPGHPEVAESLSGLGEIRRREGDYAAARALFERALTIREEALGPEHLLVSRSLNGLAVVLAQSGDLAGARALFERSLAIKEENLGPGQSALIKTIVNLAALCQHTGDYAGARSLLERALATREAMDGTEDDGTALMRNNLASVLVRTGDLAAARPLLEWTLAFREERWGPDHPRVATTLSSLALLERKTGDYAAARLLYERALAIREKAYGPDHGLVATTLNNLAILLRVTGDYTEARRLYERALAVREKAVGPEHRDVATTLNNLALLLADMGDYEEAGPLYERALAVWEKALGPEHPKVGACLNNMGLLHRQMGDLAGAKRLYERALAIREQALGPEHQDVASTLHNIANLLEDMGDPAGAAALHRRAVAIWEEGLGPEHPVLAFGLHNLAHVLTSAGTIDEALPLCERAVAIRETALGPEHPSSARSRNLLAAILFLAGDSPAALEQALRAEATARRHLSLTVGGLPERQALRYADVRTSGLDLALTLAAAGPEEAPGSGAGAWDALVRSRALVLDEVATRHRSAARSGDPETARLAGDLASARQRLANLTIRGPGSDPADWYRRLLDEARREKERAERALAERSAAFRAERAQAGVGLDEVAAALPPESALVAYVRYHRRETGRSRDDRTPSRQPVPSYLAFVLREGEEEPVVVPLGAADTIDTLVARWREQAAAGLQASRPPAEAEASCHEAGEALRRKVWDPLAASLEGSSRVFVVPDGPLHLINLAALPTGEYSHLVEHGPLLHHLSAERDLVPSSGAATGEGLLALGGPAFDETDFYAALRHEKPKRQEGMVERLAALVPFRGGTSDCGTFRDLRFAPLPGTTREVRQVASLWKRRDAPGEAVRLTGAGAGEAALKTQAPGRRVLHVATHGFFLGGECASATAATRGIAGEISTLGEETPPPPTGENPLLLSGLALAGANHREAAGPGEEDGILTAEEIAAAGEGVFGLRRAFQVAGARTLIMSLWSVEDEATREWMKALYQARLEKGLDTAASVRDASLTVLGRRREAGESTHPFYWAAFVAAGDWR